MKTLRILGLLLTTTLIFNSCSVEEKEKNQNTEFLPIFSFKMNGNYYVTNKVQMNWLDNGAFELLATLKDRNNNYQKIETRMVFSALQKSDYQWAKNMQSNEPCSTMSLKQGTITHSADAAPKEISNAGHAIIERVNKDSQYFSGKFDYTLYRTTSNGIEQIHLTDGNFNYVPYTTN